jgi:hypothetical protein
VEEYSKRVATRQIELTEFGNSDDFLSKHAKEMADKFRLAMIDQLEAVGADKPKAGKDAGGPGGYMDIWKRDVHQMFFAALKIHALMRTASDDYEYVWNTHGKVTDRRFVESIPDPGPHVRVLWSFMPTIFMIKGGGQRSVCHKGRVHAEASKAKE